MRNLKCAVLFVFATVAYSQTHPATSHEFVAFDGTLYQGKPDLAKFGLKSITIVYTASMWDKSSDLTSIPDSNVVRPLALQASKSTGIAVIDIEHWALGGDPATVALNTRKYLKTLQMFQQYAPSLKVGYYGVAPQRNYWDSIHGSRWPGYVAWQKTNNNVASIAQQASALFPSAYTFYKDQDGWQKYAIAQIEEARRIGPGKPVYVFLWPQLDKDGQGTGYLPTAYWRMELETARKYADGIVIWGGWHETWDNNAPWWLETQRFLKQNSNEN